MLANPTHSLIGNRYQLLAPLGHGGMGAVYRAADRLTGQEIALKRVTIPTEHLQFASRLSDDSAASSSTNLRMALAQEFHTLASLRHPNIIRVLDYGFDDEHQPYLAMDLLHNPRSLIAAGQQQSLDVKVDLIVQMLQALAYLHRRDIVHRDLKPDNVVVIDDDGTLRVRVLDFGLALTPDFLHKEARGLAGTLAYMAPEVLQGDPASVASDLYAVGVMIYELIVGGHPFTAPNITDMISKILRTEPDLTLLSNATTDFDLLPSASEPGDLVVIDDEGKLHIPLPQIVARLLAKHPSDRYTDAYDVIADLCAATGTPMPEESEAIRESFLQAARFVGRTNELAQLRGALDDAREGKGSLWLVGGESGVGKSRLLEELRTRALIAGTIALSGQAVAAGAHPYHLWREPLRHLILSTPPTAEDAGVFATIVPDIHKLVEDVIPFDGKDMQQHLVRAIIDLFRHQSEPVVLLLEDLQWVSESLEVLKRIAPYVGELPLLIVGSYRDDERPNLPTELPQARLLSLQRLSADDIAELTLSMLGESGQHRDVIDFVQQETEGNAFFLVETVRALAEEAGSMMDIGRVTLPPRLHAGGVERLIARRLNRVPHAAHELLKLAAVVGRELDLSLLQVILDNPGSQAVIDYPTTALDDWLTICANRAVFEVQDGHWRFAHDKLRETLLDSLSDAERIAFHHLAAEAIEATHADDLDRYATALAHHWHQAGNPLKEGRYTQTAAQQAYENGANRDAERLFRRALEIHAYEQADDPRATEANLHFELGRALYSMSSYEEARQQHRLSLEMYRQLGDQHGIAESINALGESDMRQGLLDQAEAQFQEALEMRRAAGDFTGIAYSYMNLGVIETSRDHWDNARDLFVQCLEFMEQSGTQRDLARALNNYANCLDILGSKEEARAIHMRALAIRETLQDLQGICYSVLNLGLLEFDLKQYEKARDLLLRAQQLAEQSVDRLALEVITSSLGDVYLKFENYAQAAIHYEAARELSQAIEHRAGIATSTYQLGTIALELGDYDTALLHFQNALALSVEYKLDAQIWQTLSQIAKMLKAQGKRRSALKLLAFIGAQHTSHYTANDEMVIELEASMPEHAVASAQALGAALTLDEIAAKIALGDLEL